MLAVLDVARLDNAALHQWIDDAQFGLGELHSLIHATWFQPTANAFGQSQATAAAPIPPQRTA